MNYFKKTIYLVVLFWFSCANAGSYDDFLKAVRNDEAAQVLALLQRGFDPNTAYPNGQNGLLLAVTTPSPQVLNVLIDWPGTNMDARNLVDESPLMLAALRGDLALCRRLIQKGADVNKTGWTPLHYAATSGQTAIMQLLLDENAYIDAESPNGSTPLMMAARYGSAQAVALLLQAGADPRLKNQLGMTALDFANSVSRKDVARMVQAATAALPAAPAAATVPEQPDQTDAPAAAEPDAPAQNKAPGQPDAPAKADASPEQAPKESSRPSPSPDGQ